MPGLFPDDTRAKQLTKSLVTLSELIQNHAIELPRIEEDVRIHGHCHQKSCGGLSAEQSVLKQLGDKGGIIPAGCCGVAGAYGYHLKSAPIAKIIGEQEFKPHLDKLPEDARVVADGFSCRGQIRNVSGRQPMHLAEYLAMILR